MTVQETKYLKKLCQIICDTVETEQIYLFGSHAYGTPTADSDYDLCVIIPDDTLRPADAIKRIRRALYASQETPLDVLVYRASKFRERQTAFSLEQTMQKKGYCCMSEEISSKNGISAFPQLYNRHKP